MMTTTDQSSVDIAALRDGDVDIDGFLDVLSNPRRRFVIAWLDEHSEPMAMADVADDLTNWECDTPRNRLSGEQAKSRYLALHHVHVPKMVDEGVIEHNQDRNTIGLRDAYNGITTNEKPSLPVLSRLGRAV